MSIKEQAVLAHVEGALMDVSLLGLPAEATPEGLDRFHTGAVLCPPVPRVPALLRLEQQIGLKVILYSSSRERYRRHTQAWAVLNEVPADELHMLPDDGRTPPGPHLLSLIGGLQDRYAVSHVYESRPDVANMLARLGIDVTLIEREPATGLRAV